MDKQLIFQLLMMGATLWLVFLIYLHIQTEKQNGKRRLNEKDARSTR